jgi:hypothetical protein
MATVRKPRLLDIDGDLGDAPLGSHGAEEFFQHGQEQFGHAFATAAEATKTAFEASKNIQEEFLTFWQQRFQYNTDASTKLMQCKTLPDLFSVQQDWAKQATEQYNSYLKRSMEILQSSFMPHKGDE